MKKHPEMKWSLFQRKRDKRFVLTIAFGGTWKGAKQVTAPPDVRSQRAADRWAKEQLAITTETGVVPQRGRITGESPSLRACHVQLMELRESLPDRKQATLKNNWTHLNAQILKTQSLEEGGKKVDATISELPMARVDVARARLFTRAVRAGHSPSHCRNIVFTCRTLWDTALGEKIVRTNPWRDPLVVAELPKQRNVNVLEDDPEPIDMPLPLVQATLRLDDEALALMWRVKLCVAIAGGFDDGELHGLRWKSLRHLFSETPLDDVPFFAIRKQLSLRSPDGGLGEDSPKTENRLRDVPVHWAAHAALHDWRAAWERIYCKVPSPDDYVFPGAKGQGARPKSASTIRGAMEIANARAVAAGGRELVAQEHLGLITWKATRRTFSTALKAAAVDEEDRGKLMGHSGGTVTARNYTRGQLAYLAEKIARIPIYWPLSVESVATSVRTDLQPSQTRPAGTPLSGIKPDSNEEARIGFEPTYDGFANRAGPNAPDAPWPRSPQDAGESASSAHGHGEVGRGVIRGAGDAAQTPFGPPSIGRVVGRETVAPSGTEPAASGHAGQPPGSTLAPAALERGPGVARARRRFDLEDVTSLDGRVAVGDDALPSVPEERSKGNG